MERTNSILAVLKDAEVKLHALRNKVPCGIRSVDDETDAAIKRTAEFVARLRERLNGGKS